MELQEIISKIEALEGRASELLSKADAENTTADDVKAVRTQIETEIAPEIERLQTARAEKAREEEIAGMKAQVTTLNSVIEDLKKPIPGFSLGSGSLEVPVENNPYADGSKSFFADVHRVKQNWGGAEEARNRMMAATEGKAMSEGVDAQGGYLVQPLIERQIVEAREQDNVIRSLVSKVNINTDGIQLDQLSLGTAAGWVAELAQKPETTSMALSTITASVFTAAGLATISNQLLADSNPAVDRLVTTDLAKRLVALEEAAFISGNGTGKPLGILATPNIQTQTVTPTDVSADGGLLDKVLDAISAVQTEHGEPTAIVLHPRTWVKILKDKDAQGAYTVGPDSVQSARTASKSLFGVPVVTSNRVPTNLGAGTNESCVIVGDFRSALILDRQGITVDESPHVFFTSNQTVFRAEQRVGFTAAREPKAFCVIGGAGLVNG